MATTISSEHFRELTPWPELVEAIAEAFRDPCEMPRRLHYDIPVADGSSGSLLLMPAWIPGGLIGVKIVQVFPANGKTGKASINGIYMLASAVDGQIQAVFDAQELTARRTAAASALASRFLSRERSTRLLVMGTGKLALNMVGAHASVRPIHTVYIWGRNSDKARAVAVRVRSELDLDCEVVDDLASAVKSADIISTVTTSRNPILLGCNIGPGTHIDLVGGFTPDMREADDDVIRMAEVYVDSRDGALREAGDLSSPIARGVITVTDIKGDLSQLCQRVLPGRRSDQEITVFKSVGVALEDLAASSLAFKALQAERRIPVGDC